MYMVLEANCLIGYKDFRKDVNKEYLHGLFSGWNEVLSGISQGSELGSPF